MTATPKFDEQEAVQVGRPTKLNAGLIQAVAENIKAGMPKDRAAILAGISESTFHSWLSDARRNVEKMGEEEEGEEEGEAIELNERDTLLLEFLEAVAIAEAKFIKDAVDSIRGEGPAGYKWLLEKLFRTEFGSQLEGGEPIPLQLELKLPGIVGGVAARPIEPAKMPPKEDEQYSADEPMVIE